MVKASRYIVGIDLGTTSCALAYFDTLDPERGVQVLPLMQWEERQAYTTADLLPSFAYLPPKGDIKKGTFQLPIHRQPTDSYPVVGRFARTQAVLTPGRVAHAAKSWLCHGGVDRRLGLLPWHSDEVIGDERLSPVAAAAAYLQHIKMVWDHTLAAHEPAYQLAAQQVTITVPASFDEVASQLTLEAALLAGFASENLRLLEEPQAAFYHWQNEHVLAASKLASATPKQEGEVAKVQAQFTGAIPAGEERVVLVCDIGGGTCDFSLLAVRGGGEQGFASERIAVSEHILLGGDNIDLAIAYEFERQYQEQRGRKLSSRQWAQLVFESRLLKEKALAAQEEASAADELLHVAIAGEGSSLLATAVTLALPRQRIRELVVNGFFPPVAVDAKPRGQELGLREWGLPYAKDSGITRHLAAFLAGPFLAGERQKVAAVLYTGGTLIPAFLQQLLTAAIARWQGFPPVVLTNSTMELAVARGASVYGVAHRYGRGRVGGGYPRSLYVEVAKVREGDEPSEAGRSLLCLLPKGYRGDEPIVIDQLALQIIVGTPVVFQLFSSSSRLSAPGEVLPYTQGVFHPLAPMETSLAAMGAGKKAKGQQIAVNLEVALSATGLLTVHCVAAELADAREERPRWQLQFNVQEASVAALPSVRAQLTTASKGRALVAEDTALLGAAARIDDVYGKRKLKGLEQAPNPSRLLRELEQIFGRERQKWDLPLLRSLWQPLRVGLTRRNRSEAHESAWLNLAGFVLRPGYGDNLDRFRLDELWPLFTQGMVFPQAKQVQTQWWILWRRVAGGLTKEQQAKLWGKIYPSLRQRQASPEMIMLAGSLERLDMKEKIRLGNLLVEDLGGRRTSYSEQKLWALTRIASRQPLYGGPQAVVRPQFIEPWLQELTKLERSLPAYGQLAQFYAQAARRVNDREFDLDADLRGEVLNRLIALNASPQQREMVTDYVPVDRASYDQLFGESLPPGLVLL